MKAKKIKEESDLTLLKEYHNSIGMVPSIREIVFIAFMLIFYNTGQFRWLFWVLIGVFLLGVSFVIFDKVRSVNSLLKDELMKRGFSY